ncbi:MAG: shikimate kinase [Gemmatimonadota bacterium]
MATLRTSRPALAADPSKPHIILVGLPGSGKTTVGALLAARLGRAFLDFDQEISRREGMSVSEIFAMRGEHQFRELERALTAELRHMGNMVLSSGGGWMTVAATVALIRPPAVLVYLRTTPATALKWMGHGTVSRPLLMRPDPRGELERLLAARKSAYESADLIVDVERLDPQRVTDMIAAELEAIAVLNSR